MVKYRGTTTRKLRNRTEDTRDWLREKLRNRPAKVIADQIGINPRTAENIKQGRTQLSMDKLVALCQADHDFRNAFFSLCGGQMTVLPQVAVALERAINEIMRGRS